MSASVSGVYGGWTLGRQHEAKQMLRCHWCYDEASHCGETTPAAEGEWLLDQEERVVMELTRFHKSFASRSATQMREALGLQKA